jgi:hypothetical protein
VRIGHDAYSFLPLLRSGQTQWAKPLTLAHDTLATKPPHTQASKANF